MNFTKIQGTGNDFILINCLQNNKITDFHKTAHNLCDRHFGIGGDGLIVILPPQKNMNDYQMRIFNNDGSEAEMCGNGIRCFAHYLYTNKITDKKKLNIETKAGIIKPQIINHRNNSSIIKVNMNQPEFALEKIPIKVNDSHLEFINDYEVTLKKHKFKINCVSMGNPHTIIFTDNVDKYELDLWGKKIENHKLFPEKTNVEFVEIISRDEIKMKVWERGTGITLACGTGASASVVAGIKKGYLADKVLVHLPGGDLVIEWSGEDVFMTGPSKEVFTGEVDIKDIDSVLEGNVVEHIV